VTPCNRHGLALLIWAACIAPCFARSPPPEVGTLAPDFRAHNLITGDRVDLAGERGKLVILTFWATWCGPCRRELPMLESAQKLVGKDKLTVFAVNFRETPEAAAAVKKIAKTWQLTLVEDRNGSIAGRYRISAVPHLFIIGRDGQILAEHLGYGDSSLDELVSDINSALSQPSARPEVAPPEDQAASMP
jgi:thiol-disulfide isomerase/thioredoxin